MANKAIAFLVLLLVSPAAYAATHTVGGNGGWTTGPDYSSWASGQRFVVGDTLVFNFDSTHAVDEVSQANYQNCNIANPISSSTSSPTTIELNTTGTRYFICPRSNHCSRGQRLTVTTTANSTSPGGSPPGASPSPPSSGTTPGAPGSPPGTTSSPPPPSSGATNVLGGRSGLMVGLSIVLGAVVGIMG